MIVPRARIVDTGRSDAGAGVLPGSSTGGRITWVTLDLDQNEAASVYAAEHANYLDVDLLATDGACQ